MIKFFFQTILLYLMFLFFSKLFSISQQFFLNSLSISLFNKSLLLSLLVFSLLILFLKILIYKLKEVLSKKIFFSVFFLIFLSNIINLFFSNTFNFNYFFIFLIVTLYIVIYFYEKKLRNKCYSFGLSQSLVSLIIFTQFLILIFVPLLSDFDLEDQIVSDLDTYHNDMKSSINFQTKEFIINFYSNETKYLSSTLCSDNENCVQVLKGRNDLVSKNLETNVVIDYTSLESFFYISYFTTLFFCFFLISLVVFFIIFFFQKFLFFLTIPFVWIFDPFNVTRF